MALLLDRRGADVQITEDVVKAAAGNRGKGRRSEIQITQEVVKLAAGNDSSGQEVMKLLLDPRQHLGHS
jgi:hypothetical protein